MDTCVALVQAYLHINGYFTVAEYPVLEAFRGEHARPVTDLDILAFRFAGAGHDVIRGRGRRPLGGRAFAPDLYRKLQHVIAPLFYDNRDAWIRIMRQCIAPNASIFNTDRMVRQYLLHAYSPVTDDEGAMGPTD